MSYQVVRVMAEECSVKVACSALGVSVSGYYAWRERLPSAREQSNTALLSHIRRAYDDLRSRRRVARRAHTTDSRHERPVAPNLLERDFSATAQNEKWLGDILGVWTDEGWLYLAALLDTFSRMIIGWAMSEFRDEALVQAALDMALSRRELSPELIHHTDRGSQYTADTYQLVLRDRHILISMSKKGDCYDNAMMESFFSTLRAELTELKHFRTRAEARVALFEFIEGFYNRQRLHSALGYHSPADFEAAHTKP